MISATLSPSYKDCSSLSAASDSSCSRKPLSRSSIASKCTQSKDLSQQIAILKEKAHQSFMQVMYPLALPSQIQQLHEEQIEQLHRQYQQKEQQLQQQLNELTQKVEQLQQQNSDLDKNYKHQYFELEGSDFSMENIEPIGCQDESRLDDSSIHNFIEFVSGQASNEDHLRTVRQEMKTELASIPTDTPEQLVKVQNMVDKLFEYISHLKREFVGLQEVHCQTKSRLEENEDAGVGRKQVADSLQKENKFMSEQIKRLAAEKIKVEKKAADLERTIKKLEDKIRRSEETTSTTNNKIYKSADIQPTKPSSRPDEKDKSLDLNDFIELNMNIMRSQNPKPKSGIFKQRL